MDPDEDLLWPASVSCAPGINTNGVSPRCMPLY
jgi:hypothetical protein